MITQDTTSHPRPIEVDIDTWLIMREHPTEPRAIVHRILDPSIRGGHRYLLFKWSSFPNDRPLIETYVSLRAADAAVRWHPTMVSGPAAPFPGTDAEAERAWNERLLAEHEERQRSSGEGEG